MDREPDSIAFEAVYLRELNLGLQRLLDELSAVAAELAGVPVSLLELVSGAPAPAAVERLTAHATRGLERVATVQATAIELGELIGGRILALNREAGLDESADD